MPEAEHRRSARGSGASHPQGHHGPGPPQPPHGEQKFLRKMSAGVDEINTVLVQYRLTGPNLTPIIEVYTIAGVNLIICFALFAVMLYARVSYLYKGVFYLSTEDLTVNHTHAVRSYILTYIVLHGYSSIMLLTVAFLETYEACSFWLAIGFVEFILITIFGWMTAYHTSILFGLLWLVAFLLLFQSAMSLIGFMNTLSCSSELVLRYPGNIGLTDPYHTENYIEMHDILRGNHDPMRSSQQRKLSQGMDSHGLYHGLPRDINLDTVIVNESEGTQQYKNGKKVEKKEKKDQGSHTDPSELHQELPRDINRNDVVISNEAEGAQQDKKNKKDEKKNKKDKKGEKKDKKDKKHKKDKKGKDPNGLTHEIPKDTNLTDTVMVNETEKTQQDKKNKTDEKKDNKDKKAKKAKDKKDGESRKDPLKLPKDMNQNDVVIMNETERAEPDKKDKKQTKKSKKDKKDKKDGESRKDPLKLPKDVNQNDVVIMNETERTEADKKDKKQSKKSKKDKKDKKDKKNKDESKRSSNYSQFSEARKRSKQGPAGHDRGRDPSSSSDTTTKSEKKKKKSKKK